MTQRISVNHSVWTLQIALLTSMKMTVIAAVNQTRADAEDDAGLFRVDLKSMKRLLSILP